jgi:hypothetical protein
MLLELPFVPTGRVSRQRIGLLFMSHVLCLRCLAGLRQAFGHPGPCEPPGLKFRKKSNQSADKNQSGG